MNHTIKPEIYQQTLAEHFYLAFHFSINGLSPKLGVYATTYLHRTVAMAPGLVDTPQPAMTPASQKPLVGPKEAFYGGPKVYSKAAEENGTERHPPATHPNYLPIWDGETMYPELSALTTMQ